MAEKLDREAARTLCEKPNAIARGLVFHVPFVLSLLDALDAADERIAALAEESERDITHLQEVNEMHEERIAALEAELDTLLGSLKTSNKAGLQILADLRSALRALEQAHGGGQCKCCRFTFDGREGRCFANETLTRLRAAYPEVPTPADSASERAPGTDHE